MQKIALVACLLLAGVLADVITPRVDCATHSYVDVVSKNMRMDMYYMIRTDLSYPIYYQFENITYLGQKYATVYVNCDYQVGGKCLSVYWYANGQCQQVYDYVPSFNFDIFYDYSYADNCPFGGQQSCVSFCNNNNYCTMLDSTWRVVSQRSPNGDTTDIMYYNDYFPSTIFAGYLCDGSMMYVKSNVCYP